MMCADLHGSKPPLLMSVLALTGRAGSGLATGICSPLRLPVKVDEEQHLPLCVPWHPFKNLQHITHASVVALASWQPGGAPTVARCDSLQPARFDVC